MRINVYAEELTSETELVTKQVIPNDGTEPVTFYGVRFYLASPEELHHGADDDDRSAITLWAKWTQREGNQFTTLDDLTLHLHDRVYEAILADHQESLKCDQGGERVTDIDAGNSNEWAQLPHDCKYKRAIDALDALKPDDFKTSQGHLTPAFREINYKKAFLRVIEIVNTIAHEGKSHG